MAPRAAPQFERETFTTSRELEYLSADELEKQTGYTRDCWWPAVIVKETLDNALDAAETAGVPPEITVRLDGPRLEIRDNGAGVPAEVVQHLLDYSTRTSDKIAYVSPTRGAQGNALKTILAMPYVLDGSSSAAVEIEAQGLRHQISIRTDQVARRPRIDYQQRQLTVQTTGTAIFVARNQACSDLDENYEIVLRLVSDFALFNPHATFQLDHKKQSLTFSAHDPEWRKWSPRDPTSAHWYTQERFEELIASYVATGKPCNVRDFLAQFRGLKRTATRMEVLAHAGLTRGLKLEELADRQRGTFERDTLCRLITAMQDASTPPPPEALGVLGKNHFLLNLPGDDRSFRYARRMGVSELGLPYVVEAAARMTDNELLQGLHVGLNWSVPLSNPLQDSRFNLADGSSTFGLEGLLHHQRVDAVVDPLALILHIAMPRFDFLDRGKGSVELSPLVAQAVAETIGSVVKEWAAIKRSRDRQHAQQARRQEELLRRGRPIEITVKEAAFSVMANAYQKASGGGTLPAHARQIMYAARGKILEITGRQALDDDYFTQTLLPEYMREHSDETAGWDVVYDDRGHLIEPHTGYRIGIGTIAVREYLREAAKNSGLPNLALPDLSFQFPTTGPRHRYGGILFVEKEGFFPLLERVRIAERYDLAIISSKGMGSTSARLLIERLSSEARIFVLHDFDKSGFSIAGILGRDTNRYQFTAAPEVLDIGLRLSDVQHHGLESEIVDYPSNSNPTANLRDNGATDEEIKFLVGEPDKNGHYHGRRVELNAFTSDQFVGWLEAKLQLHQVGKVIPDAETLEKAYRRAIMLHTHDRHIRQASVEAERAGQQARVPKDLRGRLEQKLAEAPLLAWDDVVSEIAQNARTRKP
jgi:DNA topoisomerase VI subunit B